MLSGGIATIAAICTMRRESRCRGSVGTRRALNAKEPGGVGGWCIVFAAQTVGRSWACRGRDHRTNVPADHPRCAGCDAVDSNGYAGDGCHVDAIKHTDANAIGDGDLAGDGERDGREHGVSNGYCDP
jgi:hypothetical protein